MICNCPNETDTKVTIEGVVYCLSKDVIPPIRQPLSFNDPKYFEEVSWTIALKFEEKSFNSYFSFYPNFYNSHQNFLQTGYNKEEAKIWSHTFENNSFQVFQGVREPFIIETVSTNKNVSKFLNNIQIESEALRYQNSWDFSQWSDKGFDTLTIYNNTNNSGRLKLNPLKRLSDSKKYPILNSDGTQSITFAEVDERQIVNYFYNRVKNESRNIPQWIWDYNMINKTINSRVVGFKGKGLLERMRGNSFIIRLENESESRFKINFKDIIQEETNYDN